MGQEPEQLRAEIARTRSELGQDLDLLTEKVSPGAIAERRVAATKGALTSVKERVMGVAHSTTGSAHDAAGGAASSVGSAASSAASAVGGAPAAVKEQATGNPLAAGLIAFGAGWLLSSLLPASKAEARAAGQVKDAVAEPVKETLSLAVAEAKDELAPAAQHAAEAVKGTATEAVETVRSDATEAVGTVKDQAADSAGTVKDQAQEAKDQAQSAASGAPGDGATQGYALPPVATPDAASWSEDPLTAPLPKR